MALSDIQTLITGSLSSLGTTALSILTAVIGVAVAYFAFKWGWRKIKGAVR